MKGAYYTLEALIAAFLIVSIFALMFLGTPTNPEINRANLKTDIYKGLDVMNTKGELRNYAINNDATSIKNELANFVPLTVSLDVTLYNRNFTSVTSTFNEKAADTVAVSYYISGNAGNYTPREVRVFAWGFR